MRCPRHQCEREINREKLKDIPVFLAQRRIGQQPLRIAMRVLAGAGGRFALHQLALLRGKAPDRPVDMALVGILGHENNFLGSWGRRRPLQRGSDRILLDRRKRWVEFAAVLKSCAGQCKAAAPEHALVGNLLQC